MQSDSTAIQRNFVSFPTSGAAALPSVDREQILRRLELLGRFLDDAYRLPGTQITFGWDGLIGLVPFVGDALTTLLASYFLWEAHRLGVPKWTLAKMVGNVAIDFVAGAVPLVGDLVDIGWKANRRNLRLLQRALKRQAGARRTDLAAARDLRF